jgi:hypothetical protein
MKRRAHIFEGSHGDKITALVGDASKILSADADGSYGQLFYLLWSLFFAVLALLTYYCTVGFLSFFLL